MDDAWLVVLVSWAAAMAVLGGVLLRARRRRSGPA